MGAACSRMPIPAVTLVKRTIQSSQNCGVRHASETATLWVETRADRLAGAVQPSGFQPSRGTRMVKTPNIMKTK